MDTRVGKGFVALMLVIMLLSVSAIIVGTNQANALTEGSFTYTVSNGEATITDYTGAGAVISIPSELGGFPVTTIGDRSFMSKNTLTSVTIPDCVTHIGTYPFDGCGNLVTIYVDEDNPSYASSNGVLYNHDLTNLVKYPEGITSLSFSIPDGVNTLTDYAFTSVDHLRSIAIPSSLSSIGTSQFTICSVLNDFTVDINSPYYSSSGGVLYDKFATTLVCYANGLTDASFTIPGTVTNIAPYAFYNCRATTVTIPEGVKSIGEFAFCQCAITSVTIPDSVTSMGNYSFDNCNSVTSVHIGNGLTYVSNYSFFASQHLATVSIGSNVQIIGADAFGLCGELTSFNIPSKVKTIGDGAFWQAHAASVTIPEGVRSIGNYAFKDCVLLESITIPDSVTSMGNTTFSGCTALASATIGNGAKYIGTDAFKSCPALTTVSVGRNVTWIGNSAFYADLLLASITIPGNVTTIGTSVFQNCEALTSITFKGMVAPTSVGTNWISGIDAGKLGHAYEASNFPAPGQRFYGLLMSGVIPAIPGAPNSLTAVAGYQQVTLTWNAPALTSGYAVDYYLVNQGGVGTGDHIVGTTATITGLTNGQTYSFTVQTHTEIGTSAQSAPASGTPSDIPGVPTSLNAVPGNAFVTLSWTAPAFHGSAIDYYIVSQDGSALPTHYVETQATISSLTNGQSYSFTVKAHNLGGYGQETSAVVTTPYTLPNAPTGLSATPGIDNVTLAWTAAGNGGASIGYYAVYQWIGGSWSDVVHVAGTSATIHGLTSGVSYEFAVAAHNSAGLSDKSASASATPSIYITVDATPSAQYVNGTTAGAFTIDVTATSSLPSITLVSANVSQYLNGALTGNLAFTVSGTSYTSTMPLSPAVGTNLFTFMFNDSVGNSVTKSITVIRDDVDPTVSIVSPLTGSFNNTGSVTISWTAGDSLSGLEHFELQLDGGVILTVPSDVASFQENELADGSHTMVVTAYDNAGNHMQASTMFTVDTVDPTVCIVSPANGSYCNGSATIVWTSTDALSGLAYHELRMDDGVTVTVPADVQELQFTGLAAGNHTLTLVAYDNAGNHNQTNVSFIVSTTGPIISCTPSSPVYTNQDWIEVHVSMRDAVPMTTGNVSMYSNGVLMEHYAIFGMAGQNSSGYFYILYLESGVNHYRVTVNDSAGNSATLDVTIYRDATPPTVHITSPANHAYNNTGSMDLEWSSTDSIGIDRYEIFVNGGQVATLGPGNSTYAMSLPEGNDEIWIYVYDMAGNSAHATVNVIVDLTGPIVAITSPVEGGGTMSSMTVTWQGADPLSGIARYVVSMDGGDGIETSAATHSYEFTGLSAGSHTVKVIAFDNTGSSADHSVTFTVDTAAPAISSATPTGENVSRNAVIVIAFSEAMDHNSTAITIAGVDGTLTWNGNTATFTPSSPLAYGTAYTVTVNASDIAGNAITTTESFTTQIGFGIISGVIRDAAGNVVAGATVTLSNGMTATTDANGAFSFSNVTAGSFNLTVSKNGYDTFTQSVSATAGETTALGSVSVVSTGSATNDGGIFAIVVVIAVVALGFILILLVRREKKKE